MYTQRSIACQGGEGMDLVIILKMVASILGMLSLVFVEDEGGVRPWKM